MKKLIPLLITILFFGELSAQVYVDENATGTNNGTSWNNAFTDLQSAIAIAVSGTEIWIAEGTYKPTSTADRTITFDLPSDISIYGGFSPANGSIDMATRDSNTYESILSGDIGTVGDDNDNSNIVVKTEDVLNITADGLIIQDASARGTDELSTGWFQLNVSTASQINISRCIFRNNQGPYGAAFVNLSIDSDTNIDFEHCIFSGNITYFTTLGSGFGGAIINYSVQSNSQMTLDNCLLYDNGAAGYGGGIYNLNENNSTLELNLINNSICNNLAAAGEGTAIYNEGEGISLNIVNSLLWNSEVNVTPSEIFNLDPITLDISNSLVVGVDNTPFNGIDGIFPSSITFFLVENITFNDYANNDFTPTDFAWTIDAGDNTEVNVLEDLIYNNRIIDGNIDGTATVDIGVYEYERDCLPFVAQTNPITVQLDASGNYDLTQADKNAIVNGSEGEFLSFSYSQESFTCADISSVDIVVTISEVCTGLSEDKIATITVEDNVAPIINCIANDTRDTNTGVCTYTVVGSEFDATFTDNCTSGIISNNLNGSNTIADEVLPLGITTVVWTVDDGNGQTATCTTIITVEDNEAPIINCIADDTRDTDIGICAYTVVGSEFDATFTDNCTSGIISNDLNGSSTIADEVLPLGITTVVWTVDDGNGQTATCTTIITIEDNEAPIINCIADDTRDTDTGVCTYAIVGTEFDATFTDNCTNGIISNDLNGTTTIADEVLPLGITTVVWTVDDGNGQTATCTTIITIEDNEAPIINCIANDTRVTDTGVCTYAIVGTEFDASFTDNCTSGIISNDFNGSNTIADEVLPLGVTTVVWTVDDGSGQTATCTTIITVEDNEVPVIACPTDIAVNTDQGQCSTVVIFPDAIALDNCGIDTVVQTAGLSSGSSFPVGVNTVEYTATDSSGNTAVCSFTITVTDNEPAMAVCQDITIQLDANGDATIVAADVDGGSTDNCNVASIAIDIETFTCADIGPNDVTLTVTDVNGNVSNCIAVVTVEDVTMPTIVCMDIIVQLDATGTVSIIGNDVDNGSSDACGIVSYDLDINTFDCSNVGPNSVVLTVTDVSGNTATCTAVVTVEDITMPELECMDITLELGADGTAMITTADVLANINDACGINTTSVDIQNFDCSDIGTPVTVTVFAMDNNGNLASCAAVVTVIDALAPVVTCPADQTVDPGQGNLFYEVADYFATGEATALDNCTDPLTVFSQDPAVGTLLSDGTYTITMSAMDESGNIGTCTFELIVESVLGVDEIEFNLASVVIYPNPAQEFVILSNPQSIALQQATIYDLTGRVIKDVSLENMGVEKQINFSNLSSAIYLMVIESDKGRIIKRIVKE